MPSTGSDVSVYVPDNSKSSSSSFKCTCAFSAAVNRRFGFDSGLFYEDEVEITCYRHDRYDHRKLPLTAHLEGQNKANGIDTLDKAEDVSLPVRESENNSQHFAFGRFFLLFEIRDKNIRNGFLFVCSIFHCS